MCKAQIYNISVALSFHEGRGVIREEKSKKDSLGEYKVKKAEKHSIRRFNNINVSSLLNQFIDLIHF